MEPLKETRQVVEDMLVRGDTKRAANLLRMGRRAQEIVPACVGLSVGLIEDGLVFTLVASSEEVAAIDAAQYLDGGPCVQAAMEGTAMDMDPHDLLDENRWTLYARTSAAVGVSSSLTLPFMQKGEVIGEVNLYASTPHAFHGHHDELGKALGADARGAVLNADLSFDSRLEAAKAPGLLADQAALGAALNIIAEGQQVDLPVARSLLTEAAARAGITELQLARSLQNVATGTEDED